MKGVDFFQYSTDNDIGFYLYGTDPLKLVQVYSYIIISQLQYEMIEVSANTVPLQIYTDAQDD
jgi:hypothetical protein